MLVPGGFSDLILKLEQLEFKLEKILGLGFRNMQEKLEKHSVTKNCSDLSLFE